MKVDKMILVAFALSGMTALIYEIVWSRPLQIIFGSTIYAVSTILTTFFVGFSLGSYLFRNISDSSKNPLRLFGIIQLVIGVYGFLILKLFSLLTPLYISLETSNLRFVQFGLLFMVLIVPATLFGGTWPLINRIYVKKEKIGKDTAVLYSWNSFGSGLGPILAGFVLIPILGIIKTSMAVASVNLVVGIMILIYSKGDGK